MSVAVSRRPSIVPVIGSAVPIVTRAGFTATRVNAAGLIELVPANQPRFDYDPVTKALKGWLIEEARTNRAPNSEDGLGWVAAGTTPPVLTQGVTHLGVTCASARFGAGMNAGFAGSRIERSLGGSVAVTNGQTDSTSEYVAISRALTGGESISVLWTGVQGTDQIAIDATNSSQYVGQFVRSSRATTWSQTGSDYPVVFLGFAVGSDVTVYITRVQCEQGSVATSYIPTTAAVTRNADDGDISDVSSFFNASEGSIFVEHGGGVAGVVNMAAKFYRDTALDEEDRILLYAASNMIFDVHSSSVQVAAINGGAYGGGLFRMAAAYRVNDFALSANGGAAATDSAGAVPVGINRLQFRQHSAAQYPNGHLRKFDYYNERLTNAELQTLSAGGAIVKRPALAFNFTAEDVAAWGAPYA